MASVPRAFGCSETWSPSRPRQPGALGRRAANRARPRRPPRSATRRGPRSARRPRSGSSLRADSPAGRSRRRGAKRPGPTARSAGRRRRRGRAWNRWSWRGSPRRCSAWWSSGGWLARRSPGYRSRADGRDRRVRRPLTEADHDLLLPEGTRLLHIGPPKTGTSSLQAAFHQNRPATLDQGVRYAGSARHSGSAVLAVTGRPSFVRDPGSPAMRKWETLLRGVRGAREPRVLISSEFFADAEPPAIKRAVEDLDRDRLHVVVTLRPLDRIITSQWQQYVQSSLKVGFEPWLEGTLKNPPGPTPTFWRRHRHDRLVERWAAEVGKERMTIIVI